MSRAVIFGSAPVADWSFVKQYLRPDDFIIAADGGRIAAEKLGLTVNWYVGDSDSGGREGDCPADILPSEKDVTDLDMAVSRGLLLGMLDFLFCGCTGGREDHHLSALGQLERIVRVGGTGMIVDPNNEIRLLTPGETIVSHLPHYHYFGVVPLDAALRGVTIRGAKYEVENTELHRWESLGISNELIPGRTCKIRIDSGSGLLIRSN
jgi:thiamine pyrophosphokinase